MFYILISLVVLFTLLHVRVHYQRKGRLVNKLPGPSPVPILGNVLVNKSSLELYQILREWAQQYYPIYRLWFGNLALILIRHPDDLEILMSSTKLIDKNFGYDFVRPWLKDGLLLTAGERWHQRRKILTPAFHFDLLKKYLEIMVEHSGKFVEYLKSEGDETIQDLRNFCSKHTMDIICESTMGVSLESKGTDAVKYREAICRMINLVFYRIKKPFIADWMLNFMPKLKKETDEVLSDLHRFIDKIVQERREYHESINNQFLNNLDKDQDSSNDIYFNENGKKKRLAVLDLLLAAEKKGLIDDAGIKEEVDTFVFAGHDTIAITLMYTIMLLAENKNAQEIARREVEDILDAKSGNLETSDLNEMKYLDRCIKESLRLFPPVPSIGRYLTEDLQFKNFMAPKGAHVTMNIIDVHRDPNFWPEPEKFDPNRFLPEQIKNRHLYCYVPFSAGPRNCIGQKFAMMELKSLLAHVLYNFYLEPVDLTKDVKIISDFVLRPSHPVRTKFTRIKSVICTRL